MVKTVLELAWLRAAKVAQLAAVRNMSIMTVFQPAHPPSIPADLRLYAVGDIHGRLDLLERLLVLIGRDAAESAARRRRVVFLGDYVDRGPDPREVVDLLCAGPPRSAAWAGFEWICLKGNHEDMMIQFIDGAEFGRAWLTNGSRTTMASYGVLDLAGLADPAILRSNLQRAMPPRHLTFLRRLPSYHVEGDYLFVHAGIRPDTPLAEQEDDDLLWIRDDFLHSDADHGYVVVHGHSAGTEAELLDNRIGIDTGACRTGRLTALGLEGTRRWLLAT